MRKLLQNRLVGFILVGLLFLAGCGGSSGGKGASTTTVTGQLKLNGSAVLQNTPVRIENTTNSSINFSTATSNTTGNFSISNVTPGNYIIYFTPTGYSELTDGIAKSVTINGPNNFLIDVTPPPPPPGS